MNKAKYQEKIEKIFQRIDAHHALAKEYIDAKNFDEAASEIGKAEGLTEAIRILRGAE